MLHPEARVGEPNAGIEEIRIIPERAVIAFDRIGAAVQSLREGGIHIPSPALRDRAWRVLTVATLGISLNFARPTDSAEATTRQQTTQQEGFGAYPSPAAADGSPPSPPPNRVFLPLAFMNFDIKHDGVPPVVITPNTPTPTEEKPTPTSTAHVIPSPTSTSTELPTPTEVPLSERVPVPDGAPVFVPGGPDSDEIPNYFVKGDPVAILLGQTIGDLEKPFRYGELVIGQRPVVQHDGEGKVTGQYTEIVYANAADLGLSSDELTEIPEYDKNNPEHKLPVYEHVLWNGTGGKMFEVTVDGASSGGPMVNGLFKADLSTQPMEVSLNGFATKTSGSRAQILIDGLVLQFNTNTDTWNISSVDRWNRRGASDWGTFLYSFPPHEHNIHLTVNKNNLIVTGSDPISIPHPLEGTDHIVSLWSNGSKPDATLRIASMKLDFPNPNGKPFQHPKERLIPSVAELAKRSKLKIFIPVDGSVGADSTLLNIIEKTGTGVINSNSVDYPDRHLEKENRATFKDRNMEVRENIKKGDNDQDIFALIDTNPGGSFMLATTGTLDGPINPWFDQEGKLTAPIGRIYQLAKKIQDAGGTLILDTNVPLRLGAVGSESPIPSPMDTTLDTVRNLIGLGISPNTLIVTYTGHIRNYNALDPETPNKMTTRLKEIKQLGVQTGLMHVSGGDGMGWAGKLTGVALDSGSEVFIPEFSAFVGRLDNSYVFSFAYDSVRQAQIERILGQQPHAGNALVESVKNLPSAVIDDLKDIFQYFTNKDYRIQKDQESRRQADAKTVVFVSPNIEQRYRAQYQPKEKTSLM